MVNYDTSIHVNLIYLPRKFKEIMIKRIASLSLLCLGMFIATGINAQATNENVNLVISNETTREQLWEMRQQLETQNIKFEYQPEFDQNRQLIAISVKVTTEDGYSGTFQTSLLDDAQKVHIIRNFNDDAEVAFCVGQCEQ
jgi:Na+-translocating ferredoxin:NAD+ oxidoreductase RnfG subunit